MSDYVFYPVTGDGLSSATAYTWNIGTINFDSPQYWTQVSSFETLTIGGTVTTGTVPGNGQNVGFVAGAIAPGALNLYTPDPALGDPYIGSNSFPVDVLLNSGSVTLGGVLMTGFNEFANLSFLGLGSEIPQFPTLDVEGANLTITGSILDTGTVVFPPINLGFETISTVVATGGGTIDLGNGATVTADGSVAAAITFHFNGAGDTLDLAGVSTTGPTAFAGTITGFTPGDTLLLPNVPASANGTPTTGNYDVATGVLTITVGDPTNITLNIPGFSTTSGPVAIVSSGNGIQVVACFLEGTRIRTVAGEVAVEALRVGDLVRTAKGETRPITWIGHGRVLATAGRRNAATPIIVRRGALAENVPSRDLHITKGHSLFLDGILVPAEYLVNHRSILWDDRAQEVSVYHIELDAHDVLIAEGAPAESYRDDGNRWMFQNGHSGWGLPPKPPCAPVLTGGPEVDAIWRRLLDRSGPSPAVPMTAEADVHLLVDGQRVDPAGQSPGRYLFCLPARPGTARIVSRADCPDVLGLARDPRRLGVAIRRVAAWRGANLSLLDAADAALEDGFHPFEADNGYRWTDGDAALPASLFAGLEDGPVEVEVLVAGAMMYRADDTHTVTIAA